GLVVAGDAGDGGVPQAHLLDGLGDAARLVHVQTRRAARGDVAEVAAAGADVTTDEESRLAVLPALEDIVAPGLIAHGVQAGSADAAFHRVVLGAHLDGAPDLLRLALDGDLGIACIDTQQKTSFGCDGHATLLALIDGQGGDRAHSPAYAARAR